MFAGSRIWTGYPSRPRVGDDRSKRPHHLGVALAACFWAFFLAMWWPTMLHKNRWLLTINPFTNLVDLVRAPLLGSMAQVQSWEVGIGLAVVGWALVFITAARTSRNVAYWL